jgi:uncharacterized alkaline shock family protein YloU
MRIYRVVVSILVLFVCAVGAACLGAASGLLPADTLSRFIKEYSLYVGPFCVLLSVLTAYLDRALLERKGIDVPLQLGNLRIASEAIEDFLKKGVEAEGFVRSCTVKITHKKKVNVQVRCTILPEKDVPQLTSYLQEKMLRELKERIGVQNVGQVQVIVRRLLAK